MATLLDVRTTWGLWDASCFVVRRGDFFLRCLDVAMVFYFAFSSCTQLLYLFRLWCGRLEVVHFGRAGVGFSFVPGHGVVRLGVSVGEKIVCRRWRGVFLFYASVI